MKPFAGIRVDGGSEHAGSEPAAPVDLEAARGRIGGFVQRSVGIAEGACRRFEFLHERHAGSVAGLRLDTQADLLAADALSPKSRCFRSEGRGDTLWP